MLRWALVVLLVALVQTTDKCPTACDCSRGLTYDCHICLQYYFRDYDAVKKNCPCLTGFIEKQPPVDYCCPRNCTACSDEGCVSCQKNATISYDNTLQVYVCTCQNNFLYSSQMDACVCQDQLEPTKYYEDPLGDACYVCPENCGCDQNGCYNCLTNLRVMETLNNGRKTCLCKPPYVQNGTRCSCPWGCDCVNVTCIPSSHRVHKDGYLQCQQPYSEINGLCVCQQPYIPYSINSTILCVCASRKQPTKYYSYSQICYICPDGCVCDQKGCIYCQESMHRKVESYTCFCQHPYTQFNNSCSCVQPYYINSQTGQCVCLSTYDAVMYVGNTELCYRCPQRCICSQNGCIFCQNDTLRTTTVQNGFEHCPCIPTASDFNGVCQCQQYSEVVNNTCVCFQKNDIFQDGINCRKCPQGCTCNLTHGCQTCPSSTNRVPVANSSGYYTCPCKTTYSENNVGVCVCQPPFVYAADNKTCECPQPDILQNGICLCISILDPEGYYDNKLDSTCIPCPLGCVCNETGCHNCQQYSLRYNFVMNGYSQCPCIQNASMWNGICTICFNNSYYYNGLCIECPQCLTCNVEGCTSCPSAMKLDTVTKQCLCIDPGMNNYLGVCMCNIGTYLPTNGTACVECPKNCYDCTNNNGSVVCLSCPDSAKSHRYNSPTTNCPCQAGYIEVGDIKSYCCHETCLSCDQEGCLSCLPFTRRQLIDKKCKCKNSLQEMGSIVCGCPDSKYIMDQSCLVCPQNCATCLYMVTVDRVQCRTCNTGMNRQNIPSSNCPCINSFTQANPVLKYCYPKYCLKPTIICEECEPPRVVKNNGNLCGCPDGYFLNTYGDCLPCQMEGCLNCTALNVCLKCDQSRLYFLTGFVCKKIMDPSLNNEYSIVQHSTGIYLVVKTDTNFREFNEVKQIYGEFQKIIQQHTGNNTVESAIKATIKAYSIISDNILEVQMDNPSAALQQYILNIHYIVLRRTNLKYRSWSGSDERGNFTAIQNDIYIHKPWIYANNQLNIMSSSLTKAAFALVIIAMVLALTAYMLGHKHNQIVFFLQTMCFLGFILQDSRLEVITMLYNLRVAIYLIEEKSVWVIPNGYWQRSKGNFSLLSQDANLLRVVGTPLFISILILSIYITYKILDKLNKLYKWKKFEKLKNPKVQIVRKYVYRTGQFFHKTCVYPLIFLSFCTYANWNAPIIIKAQAFFNWNRALAIIIPLVALILQIYQLFKEHTSLLTKIQKNIEFLLVIASSIILIIGFGDNFFLILLAVFAVKAAGYLIVRKRYLRDFTNAEYLKILIALLECGSLASVLLKIKWVVGTMTILTVFTQLIHSLLVLKMTKKKAQLARESAPSQATMQDINVSVPSDSQVQ